LILLFRVVHHRLIRSIPLGSTQLRDLRATIFCYRGVFFTARRYAHTRYCQTLPLPLGAQAYSLPDKNQCVFDLRLNGNY